MVTNCPSIHTKKLVDEPSSPESLPDYRVERITDLQPTDPLWTKWEQLAGSRLFLAPRWLMTWWQHYRTPQAKLLVLAVWDADNQLIGLAPWFLLQTWLSGRQIQSLGCGEACTDYMTILTQTQKEELVVSAIAEYIDQELSEVDHIRLEAIEEGDPASLRFAQIMTQRYGYRQTQAECLDCYRLKLPGDWEEWVMQLSRSRRRRVRQLWRDQFETGKAVVRVAHDDITLAEGFAILVQLHQSRQTALGHAGSFASPRFRSFLWDAACRHLESSQGRLQWIEWEGKPVAAQFDLEEGDTLLDYCSGIEMDSEYARPGWLGVTAGIRHAIESGRTTFDFLRGDEGYKSHWRAEPVKMFHLELVPPKARARQRAWLRASLRRTKQLAKRLLGRTTKPAQPESHGEDDS